MTRQILTTLGLAAILAACGDKAPEAEATGDSTATMAEAQAAPTIPRVMAIDVGLAADSLGQIIGGSGEVFPQPDTLYVAVRTQNTEAGAPLTVRLKQGDRTVESVSVAAGTPDASHTARALAKLPAAATAPHGKYQVEVLLDTLSQGIREITLGVD